MNRKQIAIGAGILLVFVSVAVWATNARIVWTPSEFKPFSIAPGESVSETVSFKNTGPSMINAKKLELRVNGDARRLVTVGSVSLPKTIKKGMSISVPLTIVASSPEPRGMVRGGLVLLDVHPNGSVREIFSNTLPIEITVSHIPLPPEPGEEGKATLEGIDTDANGVRDDIDRYIVFTHPESAKVREALKQEARELHVFLRDADDKAKSRANALAEGSSDCLVYIHGGIRNANLDVKDAQSEGLRSTFLNTRERSRAYNKADHWLGGMVFKGTLENQRKSKCTFDPDALPN